MLAYSPNTRSSLVRKLKEKGAADEDIAAVIEYLEKKGYLDERAFLFRFVENAGKTYGKRRIYTAARAKGFSQNILDECFDEACEQVDFVAACKKQIAKKNKGDPQKLVAALMRAGYDYDTIKQAAQKTE